MANGYADQEQEIEELKEKIEQMQLIIDGKELKTAWQLANNTTDVKEPPADRKQGQKLQCWNCQGFGHKSFDCPSPKKFTPGQGYRQERGGGPSRRGYRGGRGG
ncbi:uncharacterized protein [Branchiostoma lanceolatum]|uniref:uncharacterized protein n=1 Tax=Branchiostoma lanceolatum TaxID=7740 RepID=UPI003452F314